MSNVNLEELVRNTDSLTYINALKVTHTEIKEDFGDIAEQATYIINACDRLKKKLRRAENQYRLLMKCVHGSSPLTSNISIDDAIDEIPEIKELMEQND